jgi:hypothetical protein
MKNKGLCSTCSNDKDCDFPRKFPVWQCEEFNGYVKTKKQHKINKEKKKNKRAMAYT